MKSNKTLQVYEINGGNKKIYNSPDIIKPKSSPALEKPIHKDVRGVIQRLNKSSLRWIKEFGIKTRLPNMLYTKKGYMRSGDLHKNIQYDLILSGKIELWTFQNSKTIKKIIAPNTLIIINSHIPHLFNFLGDTILVEWWSGPFKAWFYKPYRKIIESS